MSNLVLAQVEAVFDPFAFLAALLAGVLLAFAFQLLLTHLAVAGGVSALGPIDDGGSEESPSKEKAGGAGPVRKAVTALGAWTLVTACISLFGASWLVVSMMWFPGTVTAVVTALAIWAAFYLSMTLMEVSAARTLVGATMRAAATGLRAAGSVLGRSEKKKTAATAAEITAAVKEELFADLDSGKMRKRIQEYVDRLRPEPMDPKRLREELETLLDRAEIDAVTSSEDPLLEEQHLVAKLRTRGGMDGERARSTARGVKEALSSFREARKEGKDAPSAAAEAAMRATGMSREEAEGFRRKVEGYLRSTGKDALEPEAIKRDLERMASDPRGGARALAARVASIDESTVATLVAQRTDMSSDEVERTIRRVTDALRKLRARAGGGVARTQETGYAVVEAPEEIRVRARGKIERYLDSLGRPELSHAGVREELRLLFHDPKAGGRALLHRLKSMDRDTLKAILASRRDLSEEDAERILRRLEQARDDAIARAQRLQREVERRLEQAKEEALRQAEEARKVASTAAWWSLGAAAASGLAAVAGALLAAPFV